jgi:triphosphoribosyl-dephospho-CoA synthase
MMKWQHGGNTLLGSILLLVPISMAAGYVWSQPFPAIGKLRDVILKVTHSTTSEDAAYVYDAIRMSHAGGLGMVERLDVTEKKSRDEIIKSNISLLEIFQLSSTYDSISSEWIHNFKITFEIGYPYFVSQINSTGNCNTATVNTYLKILSTIPDTLIARKAGMPKAKELSDRANQILAIGSLDSDAGRAMLSELDRELRLNRQKLNPGTTADLTVSSLAIAILEGYRP